MSSDSSDNKEETTSIHAMCTNQDGSELSTTALCPYFESPEIIKQMVKTNYGLTVTQLKPQNGYDDLNYHILVSSDHSNPYIDNVLPIGYFLKIINHRDSQKPEYLDAQIAAMEHVLKKGILCQTHIKGLHGKDITQCTSVNRQGDSVSYLVSLRTYLPGTLIADVTLTPKLLYNVGEYVARVTKALEDFQHPFYDTFEGSWSMDRIPSLQGILFAVKEEAKRQLAQQVIQAYISEVEPLKQDFRTAQIHGDLNDQNILVSVDPSLDSTPEICGLLDFQDSTKSYPIYDLTLNVAYMLLAKLSDVPLLDIPGHILAGYKSSLELNSAERAAFRNLVAGRIVQSLVMGAYTYSLNPANEYVMMTSECGWQVLKTFWDASKTQLQERWDEIVKIYK